MVHVGDHAHRIPHQIRNGLKKGLPLRDPDDPVPLLVVHHANQHPPAVGIGEPADPLEVFIPPALLVFDVLIFLLHVFFSVEIIPHCRVHLPSNRFCQLAQLFADALGLFLVIMHDGILEQGVKSLDRLYRVVSLRHRHRLYFIISTPSMGFVPFATPTSTFATPA